MLMKLNMADGRSLYCRNDSIDAFMPDMADDKLIRIVINGDLFLVTESCEQIEQMIKEGSMSMWPKPTKPEHTW